MEEEEDGEEDALVGLAHYRLPAGGAEYAPHSVFFDKSDPFEQLNACVASYQNYFQIWPLEVGAK